MKNESRLLRGGEVTFRLQRQNDPSYHDNNHMRWAGQTPDSMLDGLILIGIILVGICLGSCGRRDDKLITVKTSDGKVLKLTREQIATMAIAGGHSDWDFTNIKNPQEPGDLVLGAPLKPTPATRSNK